MSEYGKFVTICQADGIAEGEMKVYDYDENNKVMVVKQGGRLSAIGAICPHKGGLLHLGVLGRGRIRCPFHGACFDIQTGDIEDFPGMDSLPSYILSIGGQGEVKVRARLKDLNKTGRIKEMSPFSPTDDRCFVAVGGGTASTICVQTLRQEGYTGRIVMLCAETYLPYERIQLTKNINLEFEDIQYRSAEFYREHGIELQLGISATLLDTKLKRIHCSNNTWIKYDKIFFATGGKSHKPPIPGVQMKNVFSLHDYDEYLEVISALNKNVKVVFLGAGFTALEMAACLAGSVKSIVIVDRSEFALSAAYGQDIGAIYKKLFFKNGIRFELNSGITEILGDSEGKVIQVATAKGKRLACDVLILTTGVRLNTDFLTKSDLVVNTNGSINTDMHLMANIPDVYVGGDIANAPVLTNSNQRMTCGHYHLAQYHGRIAGLNMAGIIEDLRTIPYFDTNLFGKHFKQCGFGHQYELFIDGDLESFEFVVYMFDEDGNVIAVGSCNYGNLSMQFAELCAQGKRLHRSHIVGKENPHAWVNMAFDERKERCVC